MGCSRPQYVTSQTRMELSSLAVSSFGTPAGTPVLPKWELLEKQQIDGVSINYEDWHFNVRPSNTEPLLRLCLESLLSREDMEHRRDEVLALIRS